MSGPPDPALVQHLANTHERCPECGYAMRGCPSDRCPECGVVLRLSLVAPHSGGLLWLVATFGFALATAISLYLLFGLLSPVDSIIHQERLRMMIDAGYSPRGSAPIVSRILVVVAMCLICWWGVAALLVRRRRFGGISVGWRLAAVIAGAAAPVAVVLIAAYFLHQL